MTRHPHARARRGFSIIAVLAMFALAGSLFIVWTRDALQQQRQVRSAHEYAQAEWLATAALSRGAARRADDADYDGEVWRLSADELGQAYDAEVTITLTTDQEQTTVTVVVALPPGDARRVGVTRSATAPTTTRTNDPNPSSGES